MIMEDIKNKIQELIESAYTEGYEDGKNLKYDIGLNDAWECARKIGKTNWITLEKMGFENKDKEKNPSWDVIMEYSADEAMAKIKEYEEKQKRTCDTCQYGGHTLQDIKKCVNCDGRNGWAPKMTLDEAIKHCEEVADSKCDECGAEHRQLAEWLRELKRLKGEDTPKPKVGRWIEHFDESGKWYECDQCHTDWGGPVNYCPNCGAKMEGSKR